MSRNRVLGVIVPATLAAVALAAAAVAIATGGGGPARAWPSERASGMMGGGGYGMMGGRGGPMVVIRHQTRGCHTWSVNGGRFAASRSLGVRVGATVTFTDMDVMPQTLVQTRGPRATITGAAMGPGHPHGEVRFDRPGTYVFTTHAGEDELAGVHTVGPDNHLRLVVTVQS
jgi:hypothetical protein